MIKKATKDDIEILNNFKTKFLIEQLKYENPSLDIIDEIKNFDNDYVIFIAIKDDKYVGYLQGYKNNESAIIDQIYVLNDYRSLSIGEELVTEFKNFAKQNNLKNIEINIENGNDAYFLFEKMGFEITKVLMNLNV